MITGMLDERSKETNANMLKVYAYNKRGGRVF